MRANSDQTPADKIRLLAGTILLVGSAPNFPYGMIDPIAELLIHPELIVPEAMF